MKTNQSVALLTIRLVLGFLVLAQGFGKVFKFGVDNVYNNFFAKTYEDLLPDLLVIATAHYTSYVELIAGLMIVLGFKRDYALYALASVLVIVTFGHGLAEPIWDTSHVMPRLILLVALLLLPKEWDKWSADRLINYRKNQRN